MESKRDGLSKRETTNEEFKASLVNDVFGQDTNGKVQIDKVLLLIWQFRDDPIVVGFVAQFVAKYSARRDVFDGIEFYLPQLVHMIIHLEANWDDAVLESFALVISQHSLHFALQLNWILQGALEDYQPETKEGLLNLTYNALYYSRCVKLLSNIERCVVFGTPRASELLKLYEKGDISKHEFELLNLADRRFNADQLTKVNVSGGDRQLIAGWLLYKRRVRKSSCRRKSWKSRYFTASDRMLYCYRDSPDNGGELIRSMPLDGAKVSVVKRKYQNMFEVQNHDYCFTMRSTSASDAIQWVKMLQDEANCDSLFGDPLLTSSNGNIGDDSISTNNLKPSQKVRYDFYRGERNFIRDLCDVAEKLRFEERSERKVLAPGLMKIVKIPECSYLPMCNSTHAWRCVVGVMANDTRVANTKERCPVFMYFLTSRGEGGESDPIDVATYMNKRFERIASSTGLTESVLKEEENVVVNAENGVVDAENLRAELNDSKGNRQLKQFLKDNVHHAIPKSLMRRIKRKAFRDSSRAFRDSSRKDGSALQKFSSLSSVRILNMQKSNDEIVENDNVSDIAEEVISQQSLELAKEVICGETWAERSQRMLTDAKKQGMVKGNDTTAEIVGFIAKSNDDLRQEVFVMQMIHFYKSVMATEGLPIYLYTYRILSTSKTTGLIEIVQNATSIDGLKKSSNYPSKGGLLAYFHKVYGGEEAMSFKVAQRNFMLSLVGYSLISYLLGLKDRHNGNIMISIQGHLIFIDFGFAMGMAPGHACSLEKAPFKLVQDYMDVMGGKKSACFEEFKRLFVAGFEAARKNSQIALGLIEIMMYKSNFPCFSGSRYGGGVAIKNFEKKLMLAVPDHKIKKKVLALIKAAKCATGTILYDKFQYHSNGYLP